MNDIKKNLSLREFVEEQRERYQLTKTELASLIARERAEAPLTLFGVDLQCKENLEDGKKDYRFPNEITALRACIRAKLGLRGTNSPLAHLAKNADVHGRGTGTRRSRDLTVRVRGKKTRNWNEAAKTDQLCDLVDVGARLDQLQPDTLELLVSYYVLQRSAKDLAKEHKVDPARIGGRLSAALRALRQALVGLVPPRNSTDSLNHKIRKPMTEDDLLRERRIKVARMLKKRIDYEFNQEAG
ncbi:MAG: hypothetical protein GY854_04505 [Deltaproteobacteria bacterium]|nr:hypothetical protein [Deltaproteobacteria bacterium]